MSKRAWDNGAVKVIKRERNQAIALALGRKCRKHSGRFIRGPALKTDGSACVVLELVNKYIWYSVIYSFELYYFLRVLNFLIVNSCTVTAVHAPHNTYHVMFSEIRLALHCTD